MCCFRRDLSRAALVKRPLPASVEGRVLSPSIQNPVAKHTHRYTGFLMMRQKKDGNIQTVEILRK
jgi:hypothetical protein